MSSRIDDEKLLQKYEDIWTKLKNIKLNALTVYDDRYMKTKVRTYQDKVYIYFCDFNMQDEIDLGSFTVTPIDSSLVYNKKYYLQVYMHDN